MELKKRPYALEVPAMCQSQFHPSSCLEACRRHHRLLPKSPDPLLACQHTPTLRDSKIYKVYFFHCPDVATVITGPDHSMAQLLFLLGPGTVSYYPFLTMKPERPHQTSDQARSPAVAPTFPWSQGQILSVMFQVPLADSLLPP